MMNRKNSFLSRRRFLQGIAAGAAALPFARALPAFAQADLPAATISGIATIPVGDLSLTVVQDAALNGFFDYAFLGVNAAEGEIQDVLEANNLPTDAAPSVSINLAVVRTGDRIILLDTGNGLATVEQGSGRLVASLAALGIAPEDVTDVIFSHFHPDHINGATFDGELVFANAAHYFPQAEYDFLQAPPPVPEMEAIMTPANDLLGRLFASDQLTLFAADDEVVPGITAFATPGHTPGHTAFILASGDQQLIATGDATIHPVLSLARPDFYMGFDAIPDLAVESRLALLNRAADEQIRVLGYHFTFPGVGFIDRDGDAFRFIADY